MENTKNYAKKIIKDFNCDGFVIIQNKPETIKKWSKFGYNVKFDFVVFSDYEQMKNFIDGKQSFDYLDNCQKLHGEKIICCFSKSHIIIL